ncbi:dephospho-CoA kinase [Salidesulfovibrio onnuriiensis]|uniref:dephospho-CoA kinase n=1 Tax=Salidesulfovibrio onnuriiensis TaxID=2583823 RepID=UPI0011CBFE7C|nr:dephospho-CoA kinase [Salidesulfovibrio onnuriiensis]
MSETRKKRTWEALVEGSVTNMRLDKFWAAELADEGISRGKVKEWIEAGMATVNGTVETKGKCKLFGGEALTLSAPEGLAGDDAPQPETGALPVLYEDEHVLVIDKPANLTTHPAPGQPDNTLVNRLLHHYPDMASEHSGMDGQRPGIVHRLDKDTSGVMAVARTEAARLKLAGDFADRRVRKVYLALVHGRPEQSKGEIEADMGRHPTHKTKMAVVDKGGREARSSYEVLWTDPLERASLVAVRIFTGRTHQIRVHMAHIGHPLVGDEVYGPQEHALWCRETGLGDLAPRQMLHAFFLRFDHPATGEPMSFMQEPPGDFMNLLVELNRATVRTGIVGLPGSGKSAVLGMLADMGWPTFSADACVALLYAAGGDGAEMIRGRFGGQYTAPDGGVDKPALFRAMCESDEFRREIMDIIHPMVRHACMEFFGNNNDRPLAFAEVPLLLEGGWHRQGLVDQVVYVHCPDELRQGKFREIRGLDPEMLAMFDSWQWSGEQKRSQCGFTIDNSGSLDDLGAEVQRVAGELMALSAEAMKRHEDWLARLWPVLAQQFGESE